MSQYQKMIARERKWMFYLLAIWVLGAGFTPIPRVFLGLLLGSAVSLYNLWLLQRRMDAIGEAIVKKQKIRDISFLSRLAAVGIAIMIALHYDAYFNIIAVIIGIMTSYIVIMIDFFVSEFGK
ncbi:ATP synthase subunit I [Lentibacillus sp. L22]|uniref:ATP synthase subunit I n=1 Tax=Lentibacillus TaxID=175304 RepID=UPI0022B1FC80|nr:ATP synthase subunit I [Lentibacillus daqui]